MEMDIRHQQFQKIKDSINPIQNFFQNKLPEFQKLLKQSLQQLHSQNYFDHLYTKQENSDINHNSKLVIQVEGKIIGDRINLVKFLIQKFGQDFDFWEKQIDIYFYKKIYKVWNCTNQGNHSKQTYITWHTKRQHNQLFYSYVSKEDLEKVRKMRELKFTRIRILTQLCHQLHEPIQSMDKINKLYQKFKDNQLKLQIIASKKKKIGKKEKGKINSQEEEQGDKEMKPRKKKKTQCNLLPKDQEIKQIQSDKKKKLESSTQKTQNNQPVATLFNFGLVKAEQKKFTPKVKHIKFKLKQPQAFQTVLENISQNKLEDVELCPFTKDVSEQRKDRKINIFIYDSYIATNIKPTLKSDQITAIQPLNQDVNLFQYEQQTAIEIQKLFCDQQECDSSKSQNLSQESCQDFLVNDSYIEYQSNKQHEKLIFEEKRNFLFVIDQNQENQIRNTYSMVRVQRQDQPISFMKREKLQDMFDNQMKKQLIQLLHGSYQCKGKIIDQILEKYKELKKARVQNFVKQEFEKKKLEGEDRHRFVMVKSRFIQFFPQIEFQQILKIKRQQKQQMVQQQLVKRKLRLKEKKQKKKQLLNGHSLIGKQIVEQIK